MITNRIAFSFGRTHRVALIAAAFGLIGIASAHAQATAEQRAACTPDAMRLCSSEIPDVGRVTACMKAHRASLSARCQAAFAGAAPSHVASTREHVVVTTRVAANGRIIHHRRYIASGYGYRHHGHGYGGYGQSAQAMAIAAQVMGGLARACGTGSLPPDVCSMSGSMGGMGNLSGLAGLAGMGGMGGMSPY
jgi:hypothetical protein